MILSPIVTALRTLSVIPVPGKDTDKYHFALPFFPIVGIILAFLQIIIFWLLESISSSLLPLAGIILCTANYVLTGALHLDGFADTADAFGNRHSREKTLLILKDSHLGTYGVAAVAFLILLRVSLYQSLAINSKILWMIPCFGFSRLLQAILLCILPYARGNTGKAFVFSGKPSFAIILIIELVIMSTILCFYTNSFLSLLPVITGLAFAASVVTLYLQRIYGITGDGIGASSELFEVGFLTAVMIPYIK